MSLAEELKFVNFRCTAITKTHTLSTRQEITIRLQLEVFRETIELAQVIEGRNRRSSAVRPSRVPVIGTKHVS